MEHLRQLVSERKKQRNKAQFACAFMDDVFEVQMRCKFKHIKSKYPSDLANKKMLTFCRLAF
ncbi:hypothetical protein SAMN04487935_1999 [Flavobacterium noncentrifugens]|uniref:Uncharacterized protein n=1 Tax=Flavobacterium noncentrifugens TaxID=1128970 RepID=A0A1G8WZI9_9FLAO|nr:hypothetical protein SAMN04487935_1999 [Flavobacterium noncentrifugens]